MPRSCKDVPEQPLIFGVEPMRSGQRQDARDQLGRIGVWQLQVAIPQVPVLRQEEHYGHMMAPQRPVASNGLSQAPVAFHEAWQALANAGCICLETFRPDNR